ncbi:MAG: hypothetical protein A3G33_08485 [Omnitrophica bacterium RIFCSPLOWO2_12_FULL_44_17]|uniref:Uncharacterized protein n=1 Tax=Candidatus Danuiimicrobium aquiferis TaxID=1801832 RepID=A0A1G1KWN3_9BACT|nr:MAG: hypothetical protein A3B72_03705 [Omnitrophica bacterium RIFCSPHIGHO2_02_FULL_45_28]OGW90308.1 MAG: hypothetical protein A3E74_01310 [Omnitrophica bacterium RIFCSPHIGHO2_12_FULL_44_12]OGW97202.1 MAG: hypothetical protein A3G33_08485 [Omnitrophica bacterium RIFCSPLOWO2_12_FULL_44_17]OGX02258.1 MAG: hypothetical protein A3J12_08275 [Omnitrophica bacterium RIFCSPLOWO2_02_FULL_44_11]
MDQVSDTVNRERIACLKEVLAFSRQVLSDYVNGKARKEALVTAEIKLKALLDELPPDFYVKFDIAFLLGLIHDASWDGYAIQMAFLRLERLKANFGF